MGVAWTKEDTKTYERGKKPDDSLDFFLVRKKEGNWFRVIKELHIYIYIYGS